MEKFHNEFLDFRELTTMVSLVLGVILMLACPVAAFVNQTLLSYNLVDIFAGTTFFDNFYFETMNDPTNGVPLMSSLLHICGL